MRQVLCEALISRESEKRLLREAVERTRLARGGVVFVLGEAGIGKSRLVRETAACAGDLGVRVLAGRAVDGGSATPFRPFVEALAGAFRDGEPPDAPELKPYRHVLGRLAPEWGRPRAHVSPLLVYEATLRLLRILAGERGLALILEDLHWADPDSLAVVEYLADHVRAERVLVLATARNDEPGDAKTMADSLAARRVARQVLPARLSPSAVAAMVDASLAAGETLDPEALELLQERSEGLPFLVEEMLSAYLDSAGVDALPIPTSYRDIVRRRFASLDDATRAVVHAAAVLTPDFDAEYLAETTGQSYEEVVRAAKCAADANVLLRPPNGDGPTFRFRHALVPEALLADLLPEESRELRLRAAEAIVRLHPGLRGEWCERVADLLIGAGDHGRASDLLVESGRRAIRRSALATAERSLERARMLVAEDRWKRTGVDRVLVDALALQGKVDRLREVGASAHAFMSRKHGLLGTPDRLADLHLRIARGLAGTPDVSSAAAHLHHAVKLAKQAGDAVLIARTDALAAQIALDRGDSRSARRFARRAESAADQLAVPEVAVEAFRVQGRLALLEGRIAAASDLLARALRVADRADLTLWRVRLLLDAADIDELTDASTDAAENAHALAARTEAVLVQADAELTLGRLFLARHDLERAEAALQRCRDICTRFGLHLLAETAGIQAEAAALRGDRVGVRAAKSEVAEGNSAVARFEAARALVELVHEERQKGRVRLDAASARIRESRAPALLWYLDLRQLLVAVDTPEEAESGESLPRDTGGSSLRALAEAVIVGSQGLSDEAVTRFVAADEVLAPFPWRRHYGRRLVAEAALRDGWGSPAEWLATSLLFFESNRLVASAAACKGLLRRAGVKLPRRGRGKSSVPPGLEALGVTSREVDVLRLVVAGLANKEIGERLYLSPRTVETHVASLMRKLASRNRSELGARARGPLEA